VRVGIFPVMAGRQAGGPETYERRLVASLARIDSDNEWHVFCLSRAAAASFGVNAANFKFHVLQPNIRTVGMAASLPLAMLRTGIDFLHATFTPPPISPKPYVFTNHCLSSFTHPEFYDDAIRFRLNALISNGLRKARRVICVSENTRALTAELFKTPLERMSVVPNGVSEEFRVLPQQAARTRLRTRYGIDYHYLLYVGKLEKRKNIVRILEAYAQLRDRAHRDVKLLLVGRRTPTSDGIDETLARLQLHGDVIEPGYVDDGDLPAFYNAAEAFVFPSLWEGFGIPVLEAMACGTPVITANVSALPEVAGDAALLVDPYSADAIAEAMHDVLSRPELRNSLRERGLARARLFSWTRTAEQTLATYREAAAESRDVSC
jgi:glycosyltransferase involved in cell wall biosynthesis